MGQRKPRITQFQDRVDMENLTLLLGFCITGAGISSINSMKKKLR